ncbi:MAG: glycosyltransferase [Candidatus Peribacteraceae bacterium]|nr:glycosyltransferase [Candidatus Peribacteraceae bacterium]
MRIAYINHGRFPTEKAYGSQIAQVCDALTELSHEVTLFSPAFQNHITATPQEYYGLRHPLTAQQLEHYDAFQSSFVPGMLGFAVSMRAYGRALQKRLSISAQTTASELTQREFDIAYVRSPLLVPFLLRTGIPLILELHSLPRFARRRFTHACNLCRRVVCLTSPMRDQLVSWGVQPEKVIVEGDGVDLRRFENLPEQISSKARWNLPSGRSVIGYVGSLATRETLEKGVREIIDSIAVGARHALPLHDASPILWIVGGPLKWQKIYEEHARSKGLDDHVVRFQGRITAAEVPSAIAACDICIYPAPKTDHPFFMRDTSPLKLFEYLAAGRPVICADIPPVRDVVDSKSVKFFAPGDSQDLAAAIKDILDHPEEASRRAEEGRRIVQEHSWEKRMQRILQSVSGTVQP